MAHENVCIVRIVKITNILGRRGKQAGWVKRVRVENGFG